jgi:hypothetical protein
VAEKCDVDMNCRTMWTTGRDRRVA